jgi:CO/xanthine dehydrogenase Mo-binding subunit
VVAAPEGPTGGPAERDQPGPSGTEGAVIDLAGAEGDLTEPSGAVLLTLADLLAGEVVEETREYHHRRTKALDPDDGQGEAHVAFAFAAHRAVVDVDTELGLVKVVDIATAQDVGKAINPQAVEGQIEGGIAQGLGLALMEEIQVADGKLRNPSFTDYLIPTALDMPPVRVDTLELGHPDSPYGLRGVGEPPTISSTPALVAAVRAATGRPLTRVPIRPEHIVGLPGPESQDRPTAAAGRTGPPEPEDAEGRERSGPEEGAGSGRARSEGTGAGPVESRSDDLGSSKPKATGGPGPVPNGG